MQLIVNTNIDTDLPIKMSTIEQKTLDQKFDHAALLENLINDYEGVKENIKCEEKDEESCKDNENDNSNSEILDDKEVLSEGEDISKDVSNDEQAEQNKDTSNDNECQITEDLEEAKVVETIESFEVEDEKEVNEHDNVCETVKIEQIQTAKNSDENESELTTPVQVRDNDVSECDNDASEESANDKCNYATSPNRTETEEVINIADEECVNNMSVEPMDISVKESDTIDDDEKRINEQDNISNKENSEEQQNKKSDDVIADENKSNILVKDDQISVVPEKRLSTENSTEEKKKLTHICKLSNTLDILSDEEEESSKQEEVKESQKEPVVDKQCISIEDDDDIMLIDEGSLKNSCKESKASDNLSDSKEEDTNTICKEDITSDKDEKGDDVELAKTQKEPSEETVEETIKTDINVSEPAPENILVTILTKPKPLLKPTNFLKKCKKNFADMTREELEEFCIMKIVEGVVDRSNLSGIKTQLKTLAQSLEEHKKKALMITKQNRDLQVVLKSVQEEQKKHSDSTVTPLKITRSVGMQVLMTDKCGGKRKPVVGLNNSYSNTKQTKSNPSNSKKNQQIPVPRLVPAVINNSVNNKTPPGKQGSSLLHNGILSKSSPPVQKPEKRSHNKMQQNDTVDLTDDEPPNKQLQRNVNKPVRFVPPQNLMSPRQPFSSTVNSPRTVYIPISGSQTQGVRPGQTFMLKAISPQQGPRPRMGPGPALMSKQTPNSKTTRPPTRHPAPLPDSSKQFEPPNWKALPPAPELKLSKVENGIVISWKIDGYIEDNYEEIASFQLYAYQETSSPPSTALWKKIGDVKALPLPMACTLTQFMAGYKYYFAVRAVDVKSRVGQFSEPGSILLLNKM